MSANRTRIVTAGLLLLLSVALQLPTMAQVAPVQKTGRTVSTGTGSDGDLKKGVALPNPRFTDNGDGTVTDNLTGLIWLQDTNCFGSRTWSQALGDANTLADGGCSLSDGSIAGAWRLPDIKELRSLIHMGFSNPALSNAAGTAGWTEGDAFSGVVGRYWSSTTRANTPASAWRVQFSNGQILSDAKTATRGVWPVRGGQ